MHLVVSFGARLATGKRRFAVSTTRALRTRKSISVKIGERHLIFHRFGAFHLMKSGVFGLKKESVKVLTYFTDFQSAVRLRELDKTDADRAHHIALIFWYNLIVLGASLRS